MESMNSITLEWWLDTVTVTVTVYCIFLYVCIQCHTPDTYRYIHTHTHQMADRTLDFIYTNPSIFACLDTEIGLNSIATGETESETHTESHIPILAFRKTQSHMNHGKSWPFFEKKSHLRYTHSINDSNESHHASRLFNSLVELFFSQRIAHPHHHLCTAMRETEKL